MLWTIAVILLILWLLGFSLHVGGGLGSPYFSDRCDRGRNQACYRSRSVGVQSRVGLPPGVRACPRPGPVTSELSPTNPPSRHSGAMAG